MTGKRFRREDWLEFGLQQLASQGPEALKLATLCEAAGKTIGSFYHHFSDQSAFFEAMLAHWKKRNTLEIIDRTDEIADPDARARQLSAIVGAMDHQVEVGMRSFSHQNRLAAEVTAEVDRMRIGYLQAICQEGLNLPEDEARALAELEYAAFVGAQIIWPAGGSETRKKLSDLFEAMVSRYYGK
ncbi:TetR/AcrR family transcriptional regulator [Oricola sp.]|uniref:TetR/AcrR family transcriptional regulator n=1 Tax=Oricola sp. TaxID=1979950 RepID=UPI003BACEDA7